MIKHLSGEYETVEYDSEKYIILYDNVENVPYPVHWHNAIEIIMPIENYYIITVGETEYRLNPDDVIIVPSGELHSMPAIKGRRLIFQCDSSVLNNIPIFESVMRVIEVPVLITPQTDKELHILAHKTMLDIFALYNAHNELSEVRIYNLLINMITSIREYQLKNIASECDEAMLDEYSQKFTMVLRYIDMNYMHEINLEQLAEIAGYSKFHFSRIFKQYNQMSYLQYINARRIRTAEHLLMNPDISVTEVAMRSGFRSIKTFNRIFKEIKHCTPTEYKKLYTTY